MWIAFVISMKHRLCTSCHAASMDRASSPDFPVWRSPSCLAWCCENRASPVNRDWAARLAWSTCSGPGRDERGAVYERHALRTLFCESKRGLSTTLPWSSEFDCSSRFIRIDCMGVIDIGTDAKVFSWSWPSFEGFASWS